jgi:hypothetical protein
MTRENEYWPVKPIFAGRTAFCLASGPSLTREVVDQVRGRPTIVVNSSCSLAPWASVLYFTDSSWYEPRRELVEKFAGLVVSMSRTAKLELPDKVRRIQTFGDPDLQGEFPPAGSGLVRQGRSSGHTAISLAIAMGARQVALLGYDCRVVDGREHHHDEYLVGGRRDYDTEKEDPRWNNKREYSTIFVRGYSGWRDAAARAGATVLNATPGSAITEFDFADLADILSGEPRHLEAVK